MRLSRQTQASPARSPVHRILRRVGRIVVRARTRHPKQGPFLKLARRAAPEATIFATWSIGLQGRLCGRAGFTLIETMAALAIVAALGVAVQRSLVQSRHGLSAVEERLIAERVVRSLLAEVLNAADVQAGGRRGIADGCSYQIRLLPVSMPESGASRAAETGLGLPSLGRPPASEAGPLDQRTRWMPLRVIISVTTNYGKTISVETIRLGPAE
ncbi:prepilin-type N-terminal cleavage/methylation domain-containing protein [Methylobacterium nigriterrae]|uniref:prepilin-type N-terminal cleavage/methylation domain-containing protein n=1 Tax=Methylobacterium nigriterrae TaxID=3127512 RepID=UPI003D66C469